MIATRTRVAVGPAEICAGIGALVMAGSQIAIPLTATTALLSSLTVLGMAVCAFGCAWRAWGGATAIALVSFVGVTSLLIEVLGSRTGIPFGSYAYTGGLQPTIGGVPLIVPLAWFAIATAAWGTAGWIVSAQVPRVVLAALAVTAWDVFLDPQMVDAGFWVWQETPGPAFRGIPLVNYGGWLLAALIIVAIIDRIAGPQRSTPLLGLYTWVAVMQTLGFLVFFGDPVLGLVGGAAMLPFVVLGWWRWTRA